VKFYPVFSGMTVPNFGFGSYTTQRNLSNEDEEIKQPEENV